MNVLSRLIFVVKNMINGYAINGENVGSINLGYGLVL